MVNTVGQLHSQLEAVEARCRAVQDELTTARLKHASEMQAASAARQSREVSLQARPSDGL